jgi:hypothetical protein
MLLCAQQQGPAQQAGQQPQAGQLMSPPNQAQAQRLQQRPLQPSSQQQQQQQQQQVHALSEQIQMLSEQSLLSKTVWEMNIVFPLSS